MFVFYPKTWSNIYVTFKHFVNFKNYFQKVHLEIMAKQASSA